jgi:tryptophan synthase beta chain
MAALEVLAKKEGILCAIESAHAFAGAFEWLKEQGAPADRLVVINCSGRGDKDVDTAARWFDLVTAEEVAESELVRAHEGEQP